jgi:XTP/dITP diphosphohydrolase
MQRFTLVTGSKHKAAEYRAMLPGIEIETATANVDEVQSLDLEEISLKKARAAYAQLQRPVVVDDTGFYIDEWQGLPGPFFKFFEETIGITVPLKFVAGSSNRKAQARTCIAYCDGTNEFVVFGEVKGVITDDVRGPEGAFGFDYCFAPDGYDGKTYAELGLDVKNTMSHRYRALEEFKAQFSKLQSTQAA